MAILTTSSTLKNDEKIIAFTSAAANYIPMARLLGRSIKKFHPEWHLVLALADSPPDWFNINDEPFDEVLSLPDLSIGHQPAWLFSHDIEELCTAIKPFVMRYLLSRQGVCACLYFDPDMILFDRLDDLVSAFSEADILLTPHQIIPESTIDGVIDNEIGSLRHGIYNLGFLGVANNPNGVSLVSWWQERIYEFCLARVDLHLWTDQKWFNHAPVFFDRVIALKSPRFNVAPWNLSGRHLTCSDSGQYSINNEPLGFYHFTGFNSGDHSLQAARFAPKNSAVIKLLSWYATALDTEKKITPKQAWAYAHYSNGDPIRWIHRLIYRYRQDLQSSYPDPFDASGYWQWLSTQGENEYGDLINFVEDRKLDIPEIPQAEWLKWFPPPFYAPVSPSIPHLYGQAHRPTTDVLETRRTLGKFARITGEAIRSPERRRALWRMARALYSTHGLRGILSKLSS